MPTKLKIFGIGYQKLYTKETIELTSLDGVSYYSEQHFELILIIAYYL